MEKKNSLADIKQKLQEFLRTHDITPASVDVYHSFRNAINDGVLDFDDEGAVIRIVAPGFDNDDTIIGSQGYYVRLEREDLVNFEYDPRVIDTELHSEKDVHESDVLLAEDDFNCERSDLEETDVLDDNKTPIFNDSTPIFEEPNPVR